MKLKKIFKTTSFFAILFVAFLSSGCEKSANTTVYEWSATIDGVNYSYSTNGSSYPGTNDGAAHAGVAGSSVIILKDDGEFPTFTVNLPSLDLGTNLLNANSVGGAYVFSLALSSITDVYNSLYPQTQVTFNITRTGSTGDYIEGTFSGTVSKTVYGTGAIVTKTITNGVFKAYVL